MGSVTTYAGIEQPFEELEGKLTMQQLCEDINNSMYSETYRIKCINIAGKIGRGSWAVLPVIQELIKSNERRIAMAAQDALRKIDPGAPILTKEDVNKKTTYSPTDKFPVQNSNGFTTYKRPERQKIIITEEPNDDLAAGLKIYGTCNSCDKHITVHQNLKLFNEKMIGRDDKGKSHLYCTFCLRNEMYIPEVSRNVLPLSFRGIFAYYYYAFHCLAKTSTPMWLTDIESYIANHVKWGVQNPLFKYDQETYCWYIDFSKVGNSRRRVPLDNILETVQTQLAIFNLYENVPSCNVIQLFDKFKTAITDFHHHRRRPHGQKVCCPTLFGTGISTDYTQKAIPINCLKTFLPNQLIENHQRKKHYHGY